MIRRVLTATIGAALATALITFGFGWIRYTVAHETPRSKLIYPGAWLGPLHFHDGTIYHSRNSGSFGFRFGYHGLHAIWSLKRQITRVSGALGNTDRLYFDRETGSGWLLRQGAVNGIMFGSIRVDSPLATEAGADPSWITLDCVVDEFETVGKTQIRGDRFTIALAQGGKNFTPIISGTSALLGVRKLTEQGQLIVYALAEDGPRAFLVDLRQRAVVGERPLELEDTNLFAQPVTSSGSGHMMMSLGR